MTPTDSPTKNIEEKTEVIYGAENIIKYALNIISILKESVDNCTDSIGPSMFVIPNHPITKAYREMKERGIRIRFIAEITKDNIEYCKELMKICEFRHLDETKGNFGIGDGIYYTAGAKAAESSPPPLLICSTLRAFVEQQQYFFEMLWKEAIPADQRMREIEHGVEREIIETIQGVNEIRKLRNHLIELSNKEILLMLPNAGLSNGEISNSVQELAEKRPAIAIRILYSQDLASQADWTHLLHKEAMDKTNLQIRYLEGSLQSLVTILIVDSKHFLSTEPSLNDERKIPYLVTNEGTATYSNSKSTVLSYISIFNALWKQSDLYQQIKENNAELQNFNEIQKDFINIAAHELRNPIVPILNLGISLRTEEGKLTERDKLNMLDIIVRNAKRLQNLTGVLLDTTKIESRSLNLRIESMNIVKEIQEIITDFKKQILQQSNGIGVLVEFVSKCDNETIFIMAYKMRLVQVMSNLLENATKFMDMEKEGRISIIIERIKKEKEEVKISIRDNGNGIPSEILPKLFLKFARKSESGTGLGLFICKGIVEAHGGRMWVNNNADSSGATNSFTLPITQNE